MSTKIKVTVELEPTEQNIDFIVSNMLKDVFISNAKGRIISAWADESLSTKKGGENDRGRSNSVV